VTVAKQSLLNSLDKVRNINDWYQRAKFYNLDIIKAMNQIRELCDELERICPKQLWPFPNYASILFHF
jgi:glutamine synthetase type III